MSDQAPPTQPDQPPAPAPTVQVPSQVPPPGQPAPPAAPPKGNGMQLLVVLGIAVVVIVIGAVIWGSVSKNKGYNDPAQLEDALKTQVQTNLITSGSDDTVTDVTCIKAAAHQFNCVLESANGQRASVGVTVSSDGNSYVTDNG